MINCNLDYYNILYGILLVVLVESSHEKMYIPAIAATVAHFMLE